MSLLEKKVTEAQMSTNGVIAAPDRLTGTARENKAVFDRLIRAVVAQSLNPVLEELAGTAGAQAVGAQVEGVVGGTVQLILAAFKARLDQCYTKMESNAVMVANISELVRTVRIDPQTGIFTIVKWDGTTHTYNTALEKIAVDATLVGEDFVLRLADGTEQRVNLSAFIDTYSFPSGETVAFEVTGAGNQKQVSAHIRENSIGLSMLSEDAVSAIQTEADRSAQEAIVSASWAAAAGRSAGQAGEQAARAVNRAEAAEGSASSAAQSAAQAQAASGNAASSEYHARISELNAKASETASADALVNVEMGLEGRLPKTEASQMIKNVLLDSSTGVFTFTRYDGTTVDIDTGLERLVVNFNYDPLSGDLVLITERGAELRVPLTALIDDYSGGETPTAQVTVSDNNRIFTHIRGGSLSKNLLDPALQSTIDQKINANETNNATFIRFSDGQSMQEKLDSGIFHGRDGVSASVAGFYSLYTAPNGDLILVANDEMEKCPFHIDEEGNLVYTVG